MEHVGDTQAEVRAEGARRGDVRLDLLLPQCERSLRARDEMLRALREPASVARQQTRDDATGGART